MLVYFEIRNIYITNDISGWFIHCKLHQVYHIKIFIFHRTNPTVSLYFLHVPRTVSSAFIPMTQPLKFTPTTTSSSRFCTPRILMCPTIFQTSRIANSSVASHCSNISGHILKNYCSRQIRGLRYAPWRWAEWSGHLCINRTNGVYILRSWRCVWCRTGIHACHVHFQLVMAD